MPHNDAPSSLPDPTNLGAGPRELLCIGAAFIGITWSAVGLRIYVRTLMIKSFGWDDWAMLATMVAFTSQCVLSMKLGMSEMRPAQDFTIRDISHMVTNAMNVIICYILATVALKVSLALFFLRIIVQPWQRKFIVYTLIVYTCYTACYFGVAVFGCGLPINYLKNIAQDKCTIDVVTIVIPMSYAQTAFNAFLDWILVILPIHTVWHLNMPMSTKFWAGGLFLLGALGSVASLIRLSTIEGLRPGSGFFRHSNSTAIWSILEPGLGIAAASLATLRPMFKRCIESTRVGYSSEKNGKSDKSNKSDTKGQKGGQGQKLSISGRPPAGRHTGFTQFGSGDSDIELDSVELDSVELERAGTQHDLEKGPVVGEQPLQWDPTQTHLVAQRPTEHQSGPAERHVVERTSAGIWVQRTVNVTGD